MDGTASYTINQDFMRIRMAKWGLLLTKHEVEKARLREKSVRRNNPDFMREEKKTKVPKLYR